MNIINTNISGSLSLLGHNEGLYFSTLLNFGTSTGFAFDNDKWAKVIPVTSRQKHVAGGMCVSVFSCLGVALCKNVQGGDPGSLGHRATWTAVLVAHTHDQPYVSKKLTLVVLSH